jgi:hypothetical protein
MHNEKLQNMFDAEGLEQVACDTSVSSPPVNQPSTVNNTVHVYPHR